ncbi:MAG: hypothetical protein JXR64_02125 [Spirochaetales bacterium]|nr:hypothetical protein [Spirochaetales bacterium]
MNKSFSILLFIALVGCTTYNQKSITKQYSSSSRESTLSLGTIDARDRNGIPLNEKDISGLLTLVSYKTKFPLVDSIDSNFVLNFSLKENSYNTNLKNKNSVIINISIVDRISGKSVLQSIIIQNTKIPIASHDLQYKLIKKSYYTLVRKFKRDKTDE